MARPFGPVLGVVLILASPAAVVAEPRIDRVEGVFEQGQSVTITGADFGQGKTTALVWDDFEDGVDGAIINPTPKIGLWTIHSNPTYTTNQRHSGRQSLYGVHVPSNQWAGVGSVMPDGFDFYVSFWFRYDLGNCSASEGEVKLLQIKGTCLDEDNHYCGDPANRSYSPGIFSGDFGGGWWATSIFTEATCEYPIWVQLFHDDARPAMRRSFGGPAA